MLNFGFFFEVVVLRTKLLIIFNLLLLVLCGVLVPPYIIPYQYRRYVAATNENLFVSNRTAPPTILQTTV